jgi:nucleoside-diphosphate-sugar epimerase
MRIVVTGASGNVGTSVLRALIAEERVESIVGIARRQPDWQPPKVEWVTADVYDSPLAEHFRGADVVIHLAWLIQPSRDETVTRRVNVEGSERVFDAVADAGVASLVYASSVGAYSPRDVVGAPVDESWPTGGIETSFYSRHKAIVETLLDRWESRNPDVRVVRLRPALIFKGGAGSEIRRLFAGPLVPAKLLEPGRLPVMPWIAGMTTQAVHTDDVAEAYRLAAIGDASGAFNIAADPVLDAEAIGEALDARVIPLPGRIVRALASATWDLRLQPTPPGWVDMGVRSPLMSTGRALEVLGWEPDHSAGEALRDVLAGMAAPAGEPTPPLGERTGGPLRIREFLSGIGARN